MKFLKYSLFLVFTAFLASCLKEKTDLGGLLNDPGSIVSSIAETQYVNTDAGAGINGWNEATDIHTNFSFTSAPLTESIKFFTLHVAQNRDVRLSGPLTIKVSMTPLAGFTAPPAGAITIPADITIANPTGAAIFDATVAFTVNKALLNVNQHYGATFTVTSVNQGIVSALDKTVRVVFNFDPSYNTSKLTGRYQWTSSVSDPANQFGITNNKKPTVLEEDATNELTVYDFFSGSSALFAYNFLTGASLALFNPVYVMDATGKVTSIRNGNNAAAVTNIVVDPSSKFTYTASDNRTGVVKYTFTYTSTINGVVTPRTVTVTESYSYDLIQVFY